MLVIINFWLKLIKKGILNKYYGNFIIIKFDIKKCNSIYLYHVDYLFNLILHLIHNIVISTNASHGKIKIVDLFIIF